MHPDGTGGQKLVDWRQRRRSVYIKGAGMRLVEPSSAVRRSRPNAGAIIYSSAERDFSVSLRSRGYFLNQHGFWVITPETESYFQSERWSAHNGVFK